MLRGINSMCAQARGRRELLLNQRNITITYPVNIAYEYLQHVGETRMRERERCSVLVIISVVTCTYRIVQKFASKVSVVPHLQLRRRRA